MKKDITDFMAKCQNCQQVIYEHQRHATLFQRLSIAEWKWERRSMDSVVGLHKILKKFDSIWVVIDRLTKLAYFYSGKTFYIILNWGNLSLPCFGGNGMIN